MTVSSDAYYVTNKELLAEIEHFLNTYEEKEDQIDELNLLLDEIDCIYCKNENAKAELKKCKTDVQNLLKDVKESYFGGRLCEMIYMIGERYSSKSSFSGYTWREDMVSEGMVFCLKYLKNFNPEKSQNPFAYITQIFRNAFLNYIKKQKRHSLIKKTCFDKRDCIENDDKGIDYRVIME